MTFEKVCGFSHTTHFYNINVNLFVRNKKYIKFRTKVTILLFEVILSLLQPLRPFLDLQIDLRLLKMVPNDSPYPKTLVLAPNSSP